MNNILNNKKSVSALGYLIWILVKEQKIALISFCIISVFVIFMPVIISLSFTNLNINIEGIVVLSIYILPLIISLVFLPLIHQQIFSSFILKRLKVAGISSMMYALCLIAIFSIVSTIICWIAIFTILPIYSLIGAMNFNLSYSWITIILMVPVIWITFSMCGLLIGSLKVKEMFKGILLFCVIIFVITTSYTVFNLLKSSIYYPSMIGIHLAGYLSIELIFNPMGLMLFLLQSMIIESSHMEPLRTLLISLISLAWSILLFGIIINVINLK